MSLTRSLIAAAAICAASPAAAIAAPAGAPFPESGPMHDLGAAAASLSVKNLSARGPTNGQPRVASLSPKGVTTFAWGGFNGSRYVIQATRLDSKGRRGSVRTLSAANHDSTSPAVATAPDGKSTVVWISFVGHNVVQAVQIDARGRTGSIRTLTKPDHDASDAEVAASPDGTVTVVWSRDNGSKTIVQELRIDPKGKVGKTHDLSDPTNDGDLPQVATAPNGVSEVVWSHNDGSKWRAQAVRLSRSGRVGPVKTLSAAGYNAYNEGVAASANGTSTFVWALYTPSASWIQEVRRDSKGRLGKVKTLSGLASSSEQPDIADSANGTGTIVWRVWDGSVYRIQTVRLDPKGRSGRVRTLSSPSQYAKYPQVATSAGGRSTIAWQTDNGPKIIEAVTIDARGRIGGRRSLTAPSKSATDPQVGASPSGKGSITWRLQDGASYLIQAIRF